MFPNQQTVQLSGLGYNVFPSFLISNTLSYIFAYNFIGILSRQGHTASKLGLSLFLIQIYIILKSLMFTAVPNMYFVK